MSWFTFAQGSRKQQKKPREFPGFPCWVTGRFGRTSSQAFSPLPHGACRAQDNEPSALARIEDARPVRKSASFVAKLANLLLLEIKYLHRLDRLRNFLPVSADILHGRSADAAGNPAETLHSRAVGRDRLRDKLIPQFARPDVENRLAISITEILIDLCDGYFENQTRPARIGDYQIAAAAQNEQWEIPALGEVHSAFHFRNRLRLDEETRRTTDAEGGQRSQGNVFLQFHRFTTLYTPVVFRTANPFAAPSR